MARTRIMETDQGAFEAPTDRCAAYHLAGYNGQFPSMHDARQRLSDPDNRSIFAGLTQIVGTRRHYVGDQPVLTVFLAEPNAAQPYQEWKPDQVTARSTSSDQPVSTKGSPAVIYVILLVFFVVMLLLALAMLRPS